MPFMGEGPGMGGAPPAYDPHPPRTKIRPSPKTRRGADLRFPAIPYYLFPIPCRRRYCWHGASGPATGLSTTSRPSRLPTAVVTAAIKRLTLASLS